jgi:uncharacterized protein YeaO (DUF488 family)
MGSIEIKRVYEPRSRGDGERILVDRLWPRGLRKESACIDIWNKEIAPTPSLRVWFNHRADRFDIFRRRYREELKLNPAVKVLLGAIGNRKATLLYAARDTRVNHAVVLAEFLRDARGMKPSRTRLSGVVAGTVDRLGRPGFTARQFRPSR